MLSYTEDGKFRNPIQAPDSFLALSACAARRRGTNRRCVGLVTVIFTNFPLRQVDHGTAFYAMGGDGGFAAIRATLITMNFASDNTAGIAPAILDALAEANRGYARGYGNDDWTQAAERKLAEIFEREVAVFLVPTGTAANALALAQVSPPWGVVFCHAESHIATDECGAPEFFGHGLKLVACRATAPRSLRTP